MKVVYNPNKSQEELFRVTCDNCESVMEVTKDDCHVGTWGCLKLHALCVAKNVLWKNFAVR